VWSKSELELLRTFSGIIANAYERKLSEKSLQESEEKYRILIENQAEGISIIDINETFLFANPAAEKIFGVELGGLKNKSLSQFTTAKEFEKVRTETQKRITGVRATYELEIICPSGDLKTLLLSTSPYLDSNGIFIGGFGIFRDITELKKTENALKESEEKYSNIVNNANDGIYLRDLNGTIIFANRKFAEIHEYPLDEIIGRKSWEFLHPDSLKKITESRELDRVQSGYQTQGEEVGLTKSGKSVYLDIRTGPLMNHGEITGIFGIIRNISERKEYERQLTEERDRANQANTAKSEFLANMSHEIRTPMNAILGFSEALYHKLESQQHKKILKSVLSSGNLLLSLLNDILDLSKIEAGKLEIVPQPIDFSSLLQEIVLLFKDKAHAKGVELNTLIAPDFPRVILLDEIRIKQVVFNLVGNALKFTHHGYVNIHASFTKTNESIGEMQFEVEDSGIGIPETQQELIFESFRQQSGQSNRQYGGIGLGLAISKRLVEKMNGTISVSSIEGKGSTFKVFFPAVEISNRGAKRKDVYDEVPNITFDPVSILVIDDVASNIETIESLLSNSGLTISSAENGEMALEILNHSIPELIILDIRMPGMDGYEVAKHIRKNKKTKHVPVIAYTASVFGTEKNIEFSNFDGVIFKPVNRFELYEQLKRFLKYSDGIQAVKNEKPTIESYIISNPEIVCRFPEIKKILEEKHLPKWERIKDSLVLFSIEAFSKELKETAQEFNFQFLSDYCQRINEDVDMVDLESLKETLYEFPSIIEHISQVIKS